MMQGIEGKVVVVTGASSGLGEAAVRLLADHGAKLAIGARRTDRLRALADEIESKGGSIFSLGVDVTERDQVRNLVERAVGTYGRIDVLVNNAGIMPLSPIDRYKTDEWDRMIDVNIKGVLYGIAAALPHMQRQKSGHIINVASVAGHVLFPTGTVYCATKFAVRAISEGLRQEVKPYDIRTTIVSPGAVASELVETISEPDVLETMRAANEIAIPADSFARMVAFAISQPSDVDVNEIVFRPTRQQV
jgi:NADP-dependent 3-hydroxy acid dehydrogenase YdfG